MSAATQDDPLEAFAEVAYARSYHAELEPGPLRLLAALAGLRPPPAEDFNYLEIGSGAGVTLNALAAAHPRARFTGVDLHAPDVALASARARDAELENVTHVAMDAADLAGLDTGPLDVVALHGVWSWISPALRASIARFAGERMVEGGLLFASYNALPGWAAVAPLRRLLREEAARAAGAPLDRARTALERAAALRDHGAAYFTQNPAAGAMLDRLLRMDLRYVVHEHLLADWHPMASSDVAAELARGGLRRIGQIPLAENVRAFAVPACAMPLFEGEPEGVDFEARNDVVVNRFFRRDVFVRGAPRPDPAAALAYFAETPIGAVTRRPPETVELAHHTLRFTGDVYGPLLEELGRAAAPVLELADAAALAGVPRESVVEAARALLLAGVARPFATRATTPAIDGQTWTIPLAYNRAALARAAAGDPDPTVLASRAAGAGLRLGPEEARRIAACATDARDLDVRLGELAKLGILHVRPPR